jgi:eukaryotic-like serine/threonine-protein kinase
MPLAPSTRLGPYEIVSLAGSGGMGEVYRARDTRLNRTVAIKVIPERLSRDHVSCERFDREARAIANLSHPHICPLFDVGSEHGIRYLVMEFLQGETLAHKLKNGPLTLRQALRYAVEIAGALDQAHRLGIIHRDVKPGNIMLTGSGAKLLDFGIAKSGFTVLTDDNDGKTATVTAEGMLVGTYQYMAPEQLQGREADARTDIFAFGAVLYEMITGRTAFDGSSQAALIAAILEHEPRSMHDLEKSPGAPLERVIRKALAKDPDERWQTARDLKDELEWIQRENLIDNSIVPSEGKHHQIRRNAAWLAVVVCGSAVLLLAFWRAQFTQRSTPQPSVRFSIPLPTGAVFRSTDTSGPTPQLAISPDGRTIVFVAAETGTAPSLWVRELEAFSAQRLPGTEDATFPFWSHNGREIGFFSESKLKTINIDTRVQRVLANVPSGRGGTWNRQDIIVFSDNISSGLKRVHADGGSVTDATVLNRIHREASHRHPQFLPDGRHFTFFNVAPSGRLGLYVGSLDSPETKMILPGKWGSPAVVGGYLLSVHEGSLTAAAFDTDTLNLTGDRFEIADSVASGSPSGYGAFSASTGGTLIYSSGASPDRQLVWFDRDGKRLGSVEAPGEYGGPALSRDGRKLAVTKIDPKTRAPDIWIVDLFRGTETRFTFHRGTERAPVWAPDGQRIAFAADRAGLWDLFGRQMDGSEQALPAPSAWGAFTSDWSVDGRYIVFHTPAPETNWDLWTLSLPDLKGKPFLQTEFNEMLGAISPDGHWLAYTSDETGTPQVYIQSFPDAGRKLQISTRGGYEPKWSSKGDEIFYISLGRELTSVKFRDGSRVEAGLPVELFELPVPGPRPSYPSTYAVAADGRRFLVNTIVRDAPSAPISVVLNWTAKRQ